MGTSKTKSRPTSQQLYALCQDKKQNKTKKQNKNKKTIKFVWHRTPSSTANTEIENQRGPSERLSDIKRPRHCLTEKSVYPQSCHTPEQTPLCTNSHWMTWSTHVTAVCVNQNHTWRTHFCQCIPSGLCLLRQCSLC